MGKNYDTTNFNRNINKQLMRYKSNHVHNTCTLYIGYSSVFFFILNLAHHQQIFYAAFVVIGPLEDIMELFAAMDVLAFSKEASEDQLFTRA